jgi:hypothetical protein
MRPIPASSVAGATCWKRHIASANCSTQLALKGRNSDSREQIQELVRILGASIAIRLHIVRMRFRLRADERSGGLRVQRSSLRQLIRPRRPLSVLRSRHLHSMAICSDGSMSFFEHHRGTCSHHHGVEHWE